MPPSPEIAMDMDSISMPTIDDIQMGQKRRSSAEGAEYPRRRATIAVRIFPSLLLGQFPSRKYNSARSADSGRLGVMAHGQGVSSVLTLM